MQLERRDISFIGVSHFKSKAGNLVVELDPHPNDEFNYYLMHQIAMLRQVLASGGVTNNYIVLGLYEIEDGRVFAVTSMPFEEYEKIPANTHWLSEESLDKHILTL